MSLDGAFITVEGGEGSGKTTLISLLEKSLRQEGFSVVVTREPGGTPLGGAIRNLLLSKQEFSLGAEAELLLFLADRAQHLEELILPSLRLGKVVLCDRYNDSTFAYQSAARGLDIHWVKDLCDKATKGLNPDLTLFLDIDPSLGFARTTRRQSRDRIESEELDFHERIRKAYQEIGRKESKRFKTIDANRSKEEVFLEAKKYIHELFSSHRPSLH